MLSALGLLGGSQSQPWGYCETLCQGVKLLKMKKLKNCNPVLCLCECVEIRSLCWGVFLSLSFFLRQALGFLTEPRVPLIWLACPESWRNPPTPPNTHTPALMLQVCASTARFYVGAGGPNSGSCACSASSESTEPSLSESGTLGPVSSQ